jgi:hypothetical protein
MYFMASTTVGIMLVFIAVAWWVYAQLQTHTLEGVIAGLNTHQTIIYAEKAYAVGFSYFITFLCESQKYTGI